MPDIPRLSFLSLFVDDLPQAVRRYQILLGVAPEHSDSEGLPAPHPFAAAGPVVFNLGPVKLALYQCNGSSTHVGDVGIGLSVNEPGETVAARARQQGAQPFFGPAPLLGGPRALMVMMTPDRHFFEVVSPR